jgi:hypothetical protein
LSASIHEGDVIRRWSPRRLLYAVAAFLSIVILLLVLALLDHANDTSRLFGVLAVVVIAGLILGLIFMAARSEVVLTHTDIRTRGRRGAANSLRLDQVRAVAVVRAAPGWAIFIWAEAGAPIRLAAPERVFRLKAQSRAPVGTAYWGRVAASPAGVAAAQIYQQARTLQGRAGALSQAGVAALVARDRRLFRGPDVRWWSPDGECGTAP